MTAFAMRYLEFSDIRQKIQTKYDVHSKECIILREIAYSYLRQSPLKVRDLLDKSSIASPATIHKAMKCLIAKGFLKMEVDKDDGRIKYLEPTSRAIKLLNEIGKLM